MWPYGSFFVRAETGRYGASIDCLEGVIDFADTAIAFSNLGRRSADAADPDAGRRRARRRPRRRWPPAPPVATRSSTRPRRRSRSSRPPRSPARRARRPGGDPDPDADPGARPGAEGRAELDQARGQEPQGQRQRGLCVDAEACSGTVRLRTVGQGQGRKSSKRIYLTKAVTYSVGAGAAQDDQAGADQRGAQDARQAQVAVGDGATSRRRPARRSRRS